MFKFKPGNVFTKINQMDRKKAYTIGAVVVVCFIALITLASFMGDANEESFEGLNQRGYDLAQMPFVNDEAEQYLLAAKYPDMQGNNSTLLYSAEEKEARQEEDAEEAEGESFVDEDASPDFVEEDSSSSSSRGYSGRGYSGHGGSSSPTIINQLGTASAAHASGSGVSGTFGAPRGDFSPYRKNEKGKETPVQPIQNQEARKALYQFARGSQAAAGLRDGKGANAKRALQGGNIQGSEAFTGKGVDLSKLGGLTLDTNAPVSSSDFSNLDKDVAEGAQKAQDKKEEKQTLGEKLLEQFLSSMVNLGTQAIGKIADKGIDAMFAAAQKNAASRASGNEYINSLKGATSQNCTGSCDDAVHTMLGDKRYNEWKENGGTVEDHWGGLSDRKMRKRLKENGASLPSEFTRDENNMYIGNTKNGTYTERRNQVRGEVEITPSETHIDLKTDNNSGFSDADSYVRNGKYYVKGKEVTPEEYEKHLGIK